MVISLVSDAAQSSARSPRSACARRAAFLPEQWHVIRLCQVMSIGTPSLVDLYLTMKTDKSGNHFLIKCPWHVGCNGKRVRGQNFELFS